MSEIEKMYTLAMVKPLSVTVCGIGEQIINYPPFTAEKQLELIKWYLNRYGGYILDKIETERFEETLSCLTNDLWQDLTEQERTDIKIILES